MHINPTDPHTLLQHTRTSVIKQLLEYTSCIQAEIWVNRERTYTVHLRIIYNGHNARLMHDHVTVIILTMIPIVAHQNFRLRVTLASFIQPRAVVWVSCVHTEFLSHRSVCITHDEKYVPLRNTEYVERWYLHKRSEIVIKNNNHINKTRN